MISFLSRIFIKDNCDYSSLKVRSAYGLLCSLVGVFLNILLFAAKYFAGFISRSVSITADAFNNLSDAASSLITLLGFKLAEQKPHPDHPFGHGRFEYISGLVVSFLIIFMGIEVGKSSIDKILHPGATSLSLLSALILVGSVCVKLYMFLYNRSIGKKIESSAMCATAFDSFGDMASTTVVLISAVISRYTSLNIDGWCGILVALFILYTGVTSALDTINPLLGQPPSEEFVEKVEAIVHSHPEIIGIHDLVVHDYGPGRRMISLHGEVPGNMNVFEMHDVIDRIEAELLSQLKCEAVIHMDPVDVDNPFLKELGVKLSEITAAIDPALTFHDLRLVTGPTHTNIIFDIVIPCSVKLSDAKVISAIRSEINKAYGENHFCVIKTDRSYI